MKVSVRDHSLEAYHRNQRSSMLKKNEKDTHDDLLKTKSIKELLDMLIVFCRIDERRWSLSSELDSTTQTSLVVFRV